MTTNTETVLREAIEVRAAILEKLQPLQAVREELVAAIAPLEARLRDVNQAIKALTQPALAEAEETIRVLSTTSVGKRLIAQAGVYAAPADSAEAGT